MKLQDIAFYRYCLPLIHPLNMKGYLQYERQGIIVELTADDGTKGYGDAAPFTGLHQESISDIINETGNIASELYRIDLNTFSIKLEQVISPSLQFALEWALVDLLARSKNLTGAQFFNKNNSPKVKINALLSGDNKELQENAKILKTQKPEIVKIKVGKGPLEEDINLVKEIDKIFDGQIKLRLDANRSWNLEQANMFGAAVVNTNIEFVEEPVDKPADLQNFFLNTGIRFALDESLRDCSFEDIRGMTGLAAFVIKPSLFGSISFIRNWIDFAEILNVNVIFSSTFESSVGLWSIAQMASAFSKNDLAHGLDTYRWLKQDVLTSAFPAENYSIDVNDDLIGKSLNHNCLTQVPK